MKSRRHDAPGSRSTGGEPSRAKPSLPPRRAFVVQFSRDTCPGAGVFSGRIEHLSSGHRARFASRDELLSTLAKMIDDFGGPEGED